METIKVDARGLSCPQPVLLTMEALKQDAARYEILVDDHTAQQNVTRYLQKAGKTVTVSESGDSVTLSAAGGGDRLRPDACPPAGQFLLRHLCPLHCKAPSASASRGRLGVPVLSGGKQLHGASI